MGRKKKDLDDAFFADFDALDEEGNVKESEPAAPPTKKKDKKDKKDKKKGNNKKLSTFNSDDEGPELPELGMVPQEEIGNEEEEEDDDDDQAFIAPPAPTRTHGKKKKQKQQTSTFALLMDDEEEAEENEVEQEAEDDDEEEIEKDEKVKLVVGEVLDVEAHPKADRLKVCRIDAGEKHGILKVVTNATTVEVGLLIIVAPVGSTTPGSGLVIERASLRGVESQGMLCSGFDIGWTTEQDGKLAILGPGSAQPGDACPTTPPKQISEPGTKKTKSKEKKTRSFQLDSAFAELELDKEDLKEHEDGEMEIELDEQKPKKKKGKKKRLDDSLFAALADDVNDEEVGDEGTMEKDGNLMDLSTETKKDTKKKKKKSKGGEQSTKLSEEEDLDALLAEIDRREGDAPQPQVPLPEVPAEEKDTGNKKKDKKKKKSKGGDQSKKEEEEEDLDALLAELGMGGGDTKSKQAQADQGNGNLGEAADGHPAEDNENDNENENENGTNQEESTAGMSAAAKKKAKRKAKEKAKKEEEDGNQTSAGGKGKTGKVSAAVRKMQEALEAKRRAEEEAARLAEEQRLKEEEEERKREEEEQRKKEEAERRKAEKAARREQLKKEGKLLTGKAKAEAERMARAREQLLRQAGVDVSEIAPKKKPVYGKKKPQQKKNGKQETAEVAEAVEMAETVIATEESSEVMDVPAVPKEVESAPPVPTEEPIVEESWEDVAARDDWEEIAEEDLTTTKVSTVDSKTGESKAGVTQQDVGVSDDADEDDEDDADEDEDEDEDEEEDSRSSSDDDDEDSSSSEDDDEEYSTSSEEEEDEMEARLAAARERREARLREALAHRDPADLRSPICCILGHVDTGKTKILDNIRRTNVQDGEAGGITQQIGATYIPGDALQSRTEELRKGRSFELKLPGLLVIDTPGHESFSNLRSRGSGLCDIAVLVVDLMHGLEQQTIESINLLRMRKTPFIIAMNKVDRLYGWNSVTNSPIQDALTRQDAHTVKEFDHRLNQVTLQLNEQGLNVALYWKNKDPKTFVNIVPTSAITGEGIPDLLQLLVKLTQSLMVERLMFVPELQCTVLEVKQIEGLGTTIDVVLVNGALKEGDTIVVCGLGGAIVTTIKALLTPQPLREIRVKGQYIHHKELRAAMGVKIAGHNLESAVAGTQLYVVNPGDDVEALKAEAMEDMQDIFSSVDKTGEGVAVQASTLGSLEALLEFLKSPDVAIPVSAINIGPVHKKDVMRANVMMERGMKKYGVILAFDVPVTKEAREQAEDLGVKIFTADIIYHLFDQFTAYLKQVKLDEQEAAKADAVFPCVLRIIPECVFNKKDPIIVGVEVVEGIAKVGCPLCVPSQGKIDLGRIAGLEKDHKAVDKAVPGDKVAMKIEATKPEEAARLYGRHFDYNDALVSRISRKSIDVLKEMFRDELGKEDWKLVIRLKKVFNID